MHPALLDAALQAITLGGFEEAVEDAVRLPFAWRRARMYATGAVSLRVRLAPDGGGGVSLRAVDATGTPAVVVDSVLSRPVTPDGLPILGAEPRLSGLWYAAGYGRHGVLLAGITAMLLRLMMNGQQPTEDLSALRPERFYDW